MKRYSRLYAVSSSYNPFGVVERAERAYPSLCKSFVTSFLYWDELRRSLLYLPCLFCSFFSISEVSVSMVKSVTGFLVIYTLNAVPGLLIDIWKRSVITVGLGFGLEIYALLFNVRSEPVFTINVFHPSSLLYDLQKPFLRSSRKGSSEGYKLERIAREISKFCRDYIDYNIDKERQERIDKRLVKRSES